MQQTQSSKEHGKQAYGAGQKDASAVRVRVRARVCVKGRENQCISGITCLAML